MMSEEFEKSIVELRNEVVNELNKYDNGVEFYTDFIVYYSFRDLISDIAFDLMVDGKSTENYCKRIKQIMMFCANGLLDEPKESYRDKLVDGETLERESIKICNKISEIFGEHYFEENGLTNIEFFLLEFYVTLGNMLFNTDQLKKLMLKKDIDYKNDLVDFLIQEIMDSVEEKSKIRKY